MKASFLFCKKTCSLGWKGLLEGLWFTQCFFLFMKLTITAGHRLPKDTNYVSYTILSTALSKPFYRYRIITRKRLRAALNASKCSGIALLIAVCPKRYLYNGTRCNFNKVSANVSYSNSISCAKRFWDNFKGLNWASHLGQCLRYQYSIFLARWESCRIGRMWNVKCGNFVLLTGLVTKIGHRREFKSWHFER